MNLAEIKSMVRSHLTDREIKAFGFDLRKRESWEALADRCKEYASAKLEQATEVAKEVAIDLRDTAVLLADNCTGLPVAICESAQAALVWCISQMIIGWLFALEMLRKGAVDELLGEVQRLQQQRQSRVLSMLDQRLASTWKICA